MAYSVHNLLPKSNSVKNALPHYKRSELYVCLASRTKFSEMKCSKPSPENGKK